MIEPTRLRNLRGCPALATLPMASLAMPTAWAAWMCCRTATEVATVGAGWTARRIASFSSAVPMPFKG